MSKSVFVAVFTALLIGCAAPDEIREHWAFVEAELAHNLNVKSNYLQFDDLSLHYKTVGQPEEGILIWLHGTPGSWNNAGRLMAMQEFTSQALIVSPDRPGWGESERKDNPEMMPDFAVQADYLGPLIEKMAAEHPDVPLIIAGHSWGASLAPYIAIRHPESVDALMLLAGGFDPDLVTRWYNSVASLGVINSFLREPLQKANKEVNVLADELAAIDWQKLDMPVVVIQGMDDELVFPANADYVEAQLPEEQTRVLRLENQGHMLQIERMPLVSRCALALMHELLGDCKAEH